MVFDELNFVKNDIKQVVDSTAQPTTKEAYAYFFQRTKFAIKLIFQEKEILIIVVIQSLLAVIGYLLWIALIRMFSGDFSLSLTLPHQDAFTDANVFNSLFVVTMVMACPIGLLNASIGAIYLLRYTRREATLSSCLRLALSRFKALSIFSLTDSWVTLQRFKKLFLKRASKEQKLAEELLYQSWKIGTVGMLPAILNGSGLVSAGKESIGFTKHNAKEIILLQMGYQFVCMVVSIFSFLGVIFFQVLSVYGKNEDALHSVTFVLWLGAAVLISIIFIQLFLRPIFILTSTALYTEYVKKTENREAPASV